MKMKIETIELFLDLFIENLKRLENDLDVFECMLTLSEMSLTEEQHKKCYNEINKKF